MISFLDDEFSALNKYIKSTNPSVIIFLVDENTHNYCSPILLGNLGTDIPYEIVEVEPGEENKNILTVTQLWESLLEFDADRKSLIINVGGGVITDIGGFLAATYKRGIKFINIPTTLLSMVDASIGGKTGIDHQFFKNVIGTFSMPEEIFAYPDFLKTLPYEQLRSGFAEMLKHGLIADKNHWNNLKNIQLTPENISPFIVDSMKIKQKFVDEDFREQNVRKCLNFGHTIGHTIESLFMESKNIIPHGEAVAAGMIMETYISFISGLISEQSFNEVKDTIMSFYPSLPINNFSNEDIYKIMLNDKKNTNGKIKFSIIDKIGHCLYDYETNIDTIYKSLDFYKSLT